MSFDVKKHIVNHHHTGFIVKDIDKSLDFWVKKLGFEVKMRWTESEEQCAEGMGVPGGSLELAQVVGYGVMVEIARYMTAIGSDAEIKPNHVGVGHISFLVKDLPALCEYFADQGVKFVSKRIIVPELNITWVHIMDPDGIHVEFMEFFE